MPGRLQSVQAAGFDRNQRPTSSECAGKPEQFAALIRDGLDRYGAIIKRAGIQPE
jgi:hypothetical protein